MFAVLYFHAVMICYPPVVFPETIHRKHLGGKGNTTRNSVKEQTGRIMNWTVIVIGSGPAGLAASVSVKRSGSHPLILERLGSPSQKLLASGGGRCNFSNILDPDEFMSRFGRSGAFMSRQKSVCSQACNHRYSWRCAEGSDRW